MQQNFQNSLAVCKEYGHPDLFIIFTCNLKWEEIQHAVNTSASRDASVRPDIIARVFKIKLDMMISDLIKKDVLCSRRYSIVDATFEIKHVCAIIFLSSLRSGQIKSISHVCI